MSFTRRSFIKKSSYSAAAVTAFGTGVGLGDHTSLPIRTKTFTITPLVNYNVVIKGPSGLTDPQKIALFLANAADPDLSSRITKHRPGVLGVTEVTHTHGGSVELDPPVIQINNMEPPVITGLNEQPLGGGESNYTFVLPSTQPSFTIVVVYRDDPE